MLASSSSFSFWSTSYSCRLRSRELCAARRFRLTRSMRRCSFSSSVLARLRGGRLVLGSGRTWPHDFLFLTGFEALLSGAGVCEGSDDLEAARWGGEGEWSMFSIISILMVVGIMVSAVASVASAAGDADADAGAGAGAGGGAARGAAVMVDMFMVWEKRLESKECSAML